MLTRISLESVLRILPQMAAGDKVMAIFNFRHATNSKTVLSHFIARFDFRILVFWGILTIERQPELF